MPAVPTPPTRRQSITRAFSSLPPVVGSIGRLVLLESRLQLLHDRVRITAGLAHVVRPHLTQRLRRLLPFVKLLVGDRVDLAAWHRFHLGNTRVLEIAPRVGKFSCPLV